MKVAFLLLFIILAIPLPVAAGCNSERTQPTFSQAQAVAVAYGEQIAWRHWKYRDYQITVHLWEYNSETGRMVVRWQGSVVAVWNWQPKTIRECNFKRGEWQAWLGRLVF